MLTQDNLPELLNALGFKKKGSIFKKTIGSSIIEVDASKKEIRYPEAAGLVVNERQTCNFSQPENFTVLECVHRLLEKGYKPHHIELEPKWKLGHGTSGGRADVLIKDNDGRPLLIIECKTAGTEFKRGWNKTLQDGDQLFSYAQQISETQFLCLYTSDLEAGLLTYTSHIIAHRDNEKYLADNPLFKSFKTVTDVKERFAVWRDTYKLDYTTKGLFEDIIQPYHIGKDKYSLADLHAISASDQQKKYHEFATILRQHNVSGRENAFDKLVNLFLCKLVDEIENPHDLKFYWKGVAYDTHFELMDRLQQLYQSGMGKFLGEDITYINQSDVTNALRFIRQNPDATQRAVWNLFIQQKFFTNNDFSLIDVHNEKLFYQNADVLLKILQMWQDIRLSDPHGHNQFLGDMFEGFLDQGVKQSVGQYFTPTPICRFIMMSLPLESLVRDSATPPKAIDYACGAGHFLTELALQIKPLAAAHKPGVELAEYHKRLYGVEKEYRLSKVAKVSAFMYGQQEINICYGDALINQHATFPEIKDGTFDLVVANPPYSVRGFLETLPELDRKAYSLTETINDLETSNTIEAFFIERAKQLLRADGMAAIILPSSILSNGGSTYIRAREILLQYFDIVAIVEFGSGTFGKTGTSTVTLFLRRKKTAPDTATHYRERVAEWFKGCDASKRKQVIYKDEHLITQYCVHVNVPLSDYKTLLKGDIDGAWATHKHFAVYIDKFNDSTDIANLYKAKWFKALTAIEQEAEVNKRYLAFAQGIERDKLYHFVMASSQPKPVLIIRSPTETKVIQQYLGYKWSDAKGDEGIKLFKDANGHHLTPLYDETNRDNNTKLNALIAANFEGAMESIPSGLLQFCSATYIVDLIDFSKSVFDKQIGLSAKHEIELSKKWPNQTIGELCEMKAGGTPARSEHTYWNGAVKWLKISDFKDFDHIQDTEERITQAGLNNSAAKLLNVNTVVVTIFATIGRVGLLKAPMATNQAIVGLIPKSTDLQPYYLMHAVKFCVDQLLAEAAGLAQDNINQTKLAGLRIPVPSSAVQTVLIAECQAVDIECTKASKAVSERTAELLTAIDAVYKSPSQSKRLDQICTLNRGRFTHRPRNDPKFFGGKYPFIQTGDVVKAKSSKVPYTQTLNDLGLTVSKLFQPPVVLVTIAANIGDVALLDYPACFTDSVVGLTPGKEISARFLELMMRAQKTHLNVIAPQLAQKNINLEILKPLKVPVPSLAEQEQFVAKIEALEQKIADAQTVIDSALFRKQAILKKYL
jgi:type I restriction enzyme M protein